MCYRMMDKRTETMQKGMEEQSMKTEKARIASRPTVEEAPAGHAEAQAYSTFRARLQRWMAKKDETEFIS